MPLVLMVGLLVAPPPTPATEPAAAVVTALPEGTITRQRVRLEAPEAACLAYIENFSTRRWTIRVRSPEAFEALLLQSPVSKATLAGLTDMDLWSPAPDGRGFVLAPPPHVLGALTSTERRTLYRILARWSANKPERWPLVFADEAAFARLHEAGVLPPLIARVRALSYPFAGGWAFSDFSVVAAEFPDGGQLLRFLQAASAVETTIPRLRVQRVASISQALDYWTANTRNPYTKPLLEALIDADLPDGVDLATVLPGPSRERSYDLDPGDVPRDISLSSFLIASSLALPPKAAPDLREFLKRLDHEYEPAQPPEKFGDLLVLQYPGEVVAPYACAYVVAGMAFARDPVGLGLWRFMPPEEVLRRNPHFEGATFKLLRARADTPPGTPPP